MTTNLDTILGSENNIQDSLFELSKSYFPDVLPDTLKTGLFGYINEIFAHGFKQNIYHTNVLYNEYFFNTASFPASIYNKAVDYDLILSNSKPSKTTIQLAFKIDELNKFKDNNRYLLKRNKTKFLLGGFSFLLPYDVSIIIDYNTDIVNSIPKILVEYDIVNCPRISESIELLYKNNFKIRSNVQKVDNEYYLYIIVDIFQLTIEEYIKDINVVRLNDQIYYDVSYSDQLVDFYTEYYYPANTTNPLQINILDKFISDYNIGDSTKYCFFNYLDENLYRIYFTENGFNPNSNSKLITYTFSSKGSLGNFNYRGSIAVELEDNLTYFISIFNNLYPSGGYDRSSLLDIKKELFKSIKKVNTLNTDDDLKEYFNYLCETTFNSNSIMKFIKIQDDIMKREYGIYLAIFDDNDVPFSSNSVNVTFDNINSFTTAIDNTINLNDIIVYDNDDKIYRLLKNDEDYTDFKYRYTSPFLIKVRYYDDNVYRLKYYNTYLDNTYDLFLKEKTTLITDFYLLDNIHIYRDSYYDNTVKFTCNLITNITVGVSNISNRLNKVKIYAVLRSVDSNNILGYFKLDYNQMQSNLDNKNVYTCVLDGFNDIFVNDLYNLQNVLYSHITGNLHTINIPEDLSLELILIDNIPDVDRFPSYEIVSEEATARLTDLGSNIFDTNDIFICSYMLDIYKTKFLFQSLNHIINSNVYISEGKYIFDRLPLFSLETYRLNKRKTLFSQQLIDYSNKVYDGIKNLCNNTSINLKFYNTYGVSKLYKSAINLDSINNCVDLSLSFIIRLNVNYSIKLENRIKTFILKYLRDNISAHNVEFIKSNLVTAIENNFIEIKSAIFNEINTVDSLLSIKPLYNNDIIDTVYQSIVPEYLYIGYIRNNEGTVLNPKIEIIYR